MEICERQWSLWSCNTTLPPPSQLHYSFHTSYLNKHLQDWSRLWFGDCGLKACSMQKAIHLRQLQHKASQLTQLLLQDSAWKHKQMHAHGGLSAFFTRQMTNLNQPVICNICGATQRTKIVYNFQENSSCEKTGNSHTCFSLIVPVLLPISDYLLSSDSTCSAVGSIRVLVKVLLQNATEPGPHRQALCWIPAQWGHELSGLNRNHHGEITV